MSVRTIMSLLIAAMVCSGVSSAAAQDTLPRAFVHKVVFTDAPEMGRPWRGGVRTNDLLAWDFFFNVKNWAMVDLFIAGIPEIRFKAENAAPADTAKKGVLKDYFLNFTIKSRPFFGQQTGDRYMAAGGIKFYSAETRFWSGKAGEDSLQVRDKATALFITQRVKFWNRLSVNLYSSLSFDNYGSSLLRMKSSGGSSVYLVPGLQFHLGKGFYTDMEYYLTNSKYLPIEIIQFVHLGTPMENIGRDWLSFMIWGFQYRGKHLWAGVHLFNHWSFQGPVIPVFGIGVNF